MKKNWPFIFLALLVGSRIASVFPLNPSVLQDYFVYFLQHNFLPLSAFEVLWFKILNITITYAIFSLALLVNNLLLKPCSQKTQARHLLIDKILYFSFFGSLILFALRTKFRGTLPEFIEGRVFWGYWYLANLSLWFVVKTFLWGLLLLSKERLLVWSHTKNKLPKMLKLPNAINKFFKQTCSINWIYFLSLFVYLGSINSYLAWTAKVITSLNPFVLVFVALMLTLLQLHVYAFILGIFKRSNKIIEYVLVVLLSAHLLSRGIEAFLLTNFDLSLFDTLSWLKISPSLLVSYFNLSISSFFFIGLILLAMTFAMMIFYKATKRWQLQAKNYKIFLSTASLLFLLTCTNVIFFKIPISIHQQYQKILPFSYAFPKIKQERISYTHSIPPLPKEQEVLDYLENTEFEANITPDIYIFILESFRGDFVTPENAPNLYAFKREALHFPHAVSSTTCTWHGWYSIFHSRFAFEWEEAMRQKTDWGSPFLHILKKIGYKIHALSDPLHVWNSDSDKYMLRFPKDWKMSHSIYFGKDGELLDTCCNPDLWDQSILYNGKTADRDKLVIEETIEISKDSNENNVYLIFLDACHLNYSWADEDHPYYQPSFKNHEAPKYEIISWSDILLKEGIHKTLSPIERQKTINQYKNAYKCVDKRIGILLDTLRKRNQYDNSIIIVLGDHGEALLEHSQVGHGGSPYQNKINVPIYYKFLPQDQDRIKKHNKTVIASQIDIFPTLLNYLGVDGIEKPWIVGRSIFRRQFPFVVSVTPNYRRQPQTFAISSDKHKILVEFDSPRIFKSKGLNIISITDLEDNEIAYNKEKLCNEFKPAFDMIFGVFPTKTN